MLFYMQMKNWFLVFLMLTIVYLIQQRSQNYSKMAFRTNASLVSVIR